MQTYHQLMNLLYHQFSHLLIYFLVNPLFDAAFDFILMFTSNSNVIIFKLSYSLLVSLFIIVVCFKYYFISIFIALFKSIDLAV